MIYQTTNPNEMSIKILKQYLRRTKFRQSKVSLLFMVFLLFISISSWAQNQPRKNYSFRDATISEAVNQIIAGTQYRVVYSVSDLATKGQVTAALSNATVEEALRNILEKKSLTYTIRNGNTIVISAIPETSQSMVRAKGVVLDDKTGMPLRGVSVNIVGVNHGTATDVNGAFSLTLGEGMQLEFSYVGMESQHITVKGTMENIVIRMKEVVATMDQIVVTGYSTTKKDRTPGSVAVLNAKDIQDAPLRSLDMLIQGKIAGVNVQSVSGRPGESAKIRIRGTNTLTGNAEPLWVINGVPMEKDMPKMNRGELKSGDFSTLFMNGIAGINPDDIESITVLKDASAAAIYGARAAGGVIVVTTKRGKEGGMKVNYSGSVSLTTRPIRTMDLMNSSEKLKFEQELWDEFSNEKFLYNQDPANTTKLNVPYIGITGMVRGGLMQFAGWSKSQQDEYLASLANHTTDWFDELFRHSVSQKHHISLSGGGEKINYYISMGYDKKNGLLKQNYADAYSLNLSIGVVGSDKLKLDFFTSLGYQNATEPSQSTNVFRYAFFANPYERPYNEDGSYKADQTYYSMPSANGITTILHPDNGFNLLRELNETKTTTKNFSASQTVQLNWNIWDDLSFSGMGSVSYSNHTSDNINGANTYTAFMDRPFEGSTAATSQRKYGSISQITQSGLGYTLRGQFNYSKTFDEKHYVTALGGAEISYSESKGIFSKRYGYDELTGGSVTPIMPPSSSPEGDISSLTRILSGLTGQYIDKQSMASFYFDADYTYDRRYTAKLSLRTDGSNNFGQNKQFNPIWSAGLSWNIMREEFMSDQNIFSNLIFRTSMGYTGNINKSIYPNLVLTYGNDYRYIGNEYLRIGTVAGAPNPNLGWEKSFDYKFNLDMGFVKNRVNLSLEYYHKNSKDVISLVSIPSPTGFETQSYNTSTIVNSGFEVSLNVALLKNKDYSLSVFANGAYNSNKLVKYDAPNKNFQGRNVGYPTDGVFAGEFIGINPYSGLYEFKPRSDANFKNDADYDKENNFLVYLGPRTAPYNGGFGLSGLYKNFSASLSGVFSIGGKYINDISAPSSYSYLERIKPGEKGTTPQTGRNDLYGMHYNVLRAQNNRWTPGNPITNAYPRIVDVYDGAKVDGKTHTTTNRITQAALLEDVSYLKFSSISLTYRLGDKSLKKLGFRSAEVSFLMNNLFTFSTYSGIDPESPGAIYPQSKSFSLALRIGF